MKHISLFLAFLIGTSSFGYAMRPHVSCGILVSASASLFVTLFLWFWLSSYTAYSVQIAIPFYGLLVDSMLVAQHDKIEEHIWIGGINTASQLPLLQDMGITHVLAVTQYGEQARFHADSFTYHIINIHDYRSSHLLPHLHAAADFIHGALEAKGTVYIHCNVGRSRSATTLAAYLMKYRGKTVEEALAYMRVHRPVCPNSGFLSQLALFYEDLNPPSSKAPSRGTLK